jgi:hypothetical protein
MSRMRQRWNNSEGQIAVFLALIFQVLFVFFAMSVNVGMIVYQKINLQNSVDMAAYYGAMKQAEVLNAMAHINFQIRQSYKLMAWRFRVVGDFGRRIHPGNPDNPRFNNEGDELYTPEGLTQYEPSVCVSHSGFAHSAPDESLCQRQQSYRITVFDVPRVAFDPLGLGAVTSGLFSEARNVIRQQCGSTSSYNWLYGATTMYIYRMDQRNRRQWLQALAQGLSFSPNTFYELNGDDVSVGIQKTLAKNLSRSNKAGFLDPANGTARMEIFNSLGRGQRLSWKDWITAVPIVIRGKFTWNTWDGNCNVRSNFLADVTPEERNNATGGDQRLGELLQQAVLDGPIEDFQNNDLINLVGFEKNPWVMAYVGVRAKTRPLRLFTPFGGEVTLTARAFAKPFGGRMGPWYKSGWSPQSPRSNSGQDVDRLIPIHGAEYGRLISSPDTTQIERTHPNHSRYPGDPYGLKSRLALTLISATPKIDVLDIINVINEYQDPSKSHDPLSWNITTQKPPPLRTYELAVVAPDLFDATYFSIDANYMQNTYPTLLDSRRAKLRPPFIAERAFPPADLGVHFGPGNQNIDMNPSVKDNIQARVTATDYTEKFARYFWHISDWRHLLTGWMQDKPGEYSRFPADFANCRLPAPGQPFLQQQYYSGCAIGGRTGYSVKLVSMDYLNSDQHKLGSADPSTGPILNPPGTWGN